jgi:hypothetical protein
LRRNDIYVYDVDLCCCAVAAILYAGRRIDDAYGPISS